MTDQSVTDYTRDKPWSEIIYLEMIIMNNGLLKRWQKKAWRGLLLMVMVMVMVMTLALTANSAVIPVQATETPSAAPGLSLNEAVSKALEHSDTVSKANKEVDRAKELSDYANSQLNYVPIGHVGIPAVEMAYTNAMANELTWQMSRPSLTAAEDQVVLSTCQKYWAVLNAQEKVKAATSSQASALRQLQNARAAEQVGISTVATQSPIQVVLAAEAQYVGAQATLTAAQNSLSSTYNALNQLIGLQPGEKPELSDTIKYEPLKVDNLERDVSSVLERAPAITQAQQMVEMKKYLKDITVYSSGSYRPSEARKIEIEQAELDAASAKKLLSLTTRSLYYQTMSLEEAYAGSLEAVKMDEENLRVKKLMLDVGMATEADVKAEEKKLEDARYNAFNLACTHAYMVMAYNKPWAADLSAMSSSSSSS